MILPRASAVLSLSLSLFFLVLFTPRPLSSESAGVWEGERGGGERQQKGDDPLFEEAWHLKKLADDKAIVHLHAENAWNLDVTGEGIVIGFRTPIPLLSHLDLTDKQIDGGLISLEDTKYTDAEIDVKTAMVALAVGVSKNGICSRGVSPNAKFKIFPHDESDVFFHWVTGKATKSSHILVLDQLPINGSSPDLCVDCWANFQKAISNKRILVSSHGILASSIHQCNHHFSLNSPYVLYAGGHTRSGEATTHACPATLLSVPVGTHESPIPSASSYGMRDCVDLTYDPSSPSYLLAGAIALILSASPTHLTQRELAHLLAQSCYPPPRSPPSIVNGGGWRVYDDYGFGLLDVGKAVKFVMGSLPWKRIGEGKVSEATYEGPDPISSSSPLTITLDITASPHVFADWVTVTTNIEHPYAGDLSIRLVSPHGTESVLCTPLPYHVEFDFENFQKKVILTPLSHYKDFGYVSVLVLTKGGPECKPYVPRNRLTHGLYVFTATEECLDQVHLSNLLSLTHPLDMIIIEESASLPFSIHNSSVPFFTVTSADWGYVHSLRRKVDFRTRFLKTPLNFRKWTFTTIRHWNETLSGQWRLIIEDKMAGDGGTLTSFSLSLSTFQYPTIHYASPTPTPPNPTPSPFPVPSPSPVPRPPTPTPTPFVPVYCCAYQKASEYQCLTLSYKCPIMKGWAIVESQIVQDEKECRPFCPLPVTPSPVPSPTPTPTPFHPFRCCVYESDQDGIQCFHFSDPFCPQLKDSYLIDEIPYKVDRSKECRQLCQ